MKLRITCKICRREGVSVCGRDKCAIKRRPFVPGVHGPTGRSRSTPYGLQLREKQKAKRIYGLSERQFQKYFESAARRRGDTGEMLTEMLETRLDNIVYRLGLAKTRSQARQLVNHGHINVEGRKVDIPSYRLRPGQHLEVRARSKSSPYFETVKDSLAKHEAPSWLKFDADKLEGTVLTLPAGQELKQIFDPKLIVEFYSR